MLKIKFILFCVILLISVIGLFVYKKIRPEKFKSYLIWVLLLNFISILIYEPWGIFI